MNLIINDFNNSLKYVCKNQGGIGYSPNIKWSSVNNAKSYALIMEDPDAISGNFIHWYIPFISHDINEIHEITNNNTIYNNINNSINNNDNNLKNINLKNIKIFFGKNSADNIGYYGPCAPEGTGIHRYIFTIYALDSIIRINNSTIKISSSDQFLDILKAQNINILSQDTKTYKYQYKMFVK